MKQNASTLLFGGLIALIFGLSLIAVSRTGQATAGSTNGEFPEDWFAPGTQEEQISQSKLLGKPMPLLELSQWQNGERKIEDLKGKVVVIDFWATWCAPCIAAFPANNAIYAKYKDKEFEFLGVCTNSMQQNFDKIVADKKPLYPVARDEKLNTMKAWSAESYPLYAVIDRKGIVRAIGLKHEYIEKVVEKLVAEAAP